MSLTLQNPWNTPLYWIKWVKDGCQGKMKSKGWPWREEIKDKWQRRKREEEWEMRWKREGRRMEGWWRNEQVRRQLKQSTGTLDSPDCISSWQTHTHTQFKGEMKQTDQTWETLPHLPQRPHFLSAEMFRELCVCF